MADTCSGIYFWSWSTPLRPPRPPVGAQRLSTNVAWNPFFLSDWIQWLPSSSYLLDAFLRSAGAQRLRNRCTPMSSPLLDGGKGKRGGALCLCKKISILTRVEIRLVHSFARKETDNFSTYLWDGVVWFGEIWKRRFFSSNIICITCVI